MKPKHIFLLITFFFLLFYAKESTKHHTQEPKKLTKINNQTKERTDTIPLSIDFSDKNEKSENNLPNFVDLDYAIGINPTKFDYFHHNWIKDFSIDFDDVIDSYIKVPEYQITQAIKPDEFVNQNFLDPKMGIDLIDLPKSNNKGIADIKFPINIPDGRNGMKPNVLLAYDQNLENGWLGAGWDLPNEAISIDTRWGVPRFDSQFESETYLLDNEQLIQQDGALVRKYIKQPRTENQKYRKRAESDFKTVIRHGDSPDNYWWEVIDKKGVKSFYGGTPSLGIVESSVLRKNIAIGPITHWSLVEKRDLNNNFISYQYEKVFDSGIEDGSSGLTGQNLYIKKIIYTGNENQEGKYSIDFFRDRNFGESRRIDVTISTRLGFKKVTADLLRKIVINYNNTPIRSYELNYQQGAFFKSLLYEIINFDGNGEEIAKHTLEYYDDVRQSGEYVPYFANEDIDLPESELIVNVQQLGKNFFNYGEPSAISGVRSISNSDALANSSLSLGSCVLVFCPDTPIDFTLLGSTGVNFGNQSQEITTAVRLQDINGDNLPDRLNLIEGEEVSKTKTEITFAKLKPDGFGIEYKDTMNIDLARLSYGISESVFSSVESRVLIFTGSQDFNTIDRSLTYFSDVNADGLADMVSGSTVSFNCKPNNEKRPFFNNNVTCTPNPILAGSINDEVYPDTDDFFPVPLIPTEDETIAQETQKSDLIFAENKTFDFENDTLENKYELKNQQNFKEFLDDEAVFLQKNSTIGRKFFNNDPIFGGEFRGVPEITLTKSVASSNILSNSSQSSSERALVYRDINGDEYPDILSINGIQYTNSLGQLDEFVPQDFTIHSSESTVNGEVYTGAYLRSNLGRSATEYSSNTYGDVYHRTMDEKILQNNLSTAISSSVYTHSEVPDTAVNNNTVLDEVNQTLCDINGDSLLDKCYKDGTVQLGVGFGFLDAEQWGYLPNTGSTQERGYATNAVTDYRSLLLPTNGDYSNQKSYSDQLMKDLNGDEMPERIEEITNEGAWVRINLGNAFSDRIFWKGLSSLESSNSIAQSATAVFSFTITVPDVGGTSFSFGVSRFSGYAKQEFQISDLNGDGFPDLVASNNQNQINAKYSTIRRTNLLKTIKRPLGSAFTIDYSREGNSYSMPSNKWVMSKLEQNQSASDPTDDGYNKQLVTFEYGEGFYNRHDREFLGFDSIQTFHYLSNNPANPYRTITELYDNKSYFNRGKLLQKSMSDNLGFVLQKSSYNYALFDIDTGELLPDDYEIDIRNLSAFSALVEETKQFFTRNSDLDVSNSTAYSYDLFGNVRTIEAKGDTQLLNDDYIAVIQYHQDAAKNLFSIPQNISVSNSVGNVLSYRSTEIDSNGNISAINIQTKEPTEFATYNLSYDSFGNLTSIALPANHLNQRLTYNYTYDSFVNSYITRIQDSYGFSSSTNFDYRFGIANRTVDMNNQPIEYDLDGLGRIVRVRGPNEIADSRDYLIELLYYPNFDADETLSYVETKKYDPEYGLDILAYDFFDSYQRHLQNKKFSIIGDYQGNETNAYVVSGKKVYDELGRLLEEYQPIIDSGSPNQYNPSTDLAVSPKKINYDILDRLVSKSTHNPNQTTRYFYNIKLFDSRKFLSISVEDANNNTSEFLFNPKGELTSYIKPSLDGITLGNRYLYYYNPLGKLIQSTDSEFSYFTYNYDMMGRLASKTSLDNGTTEYVYDSSSNLIQETNEYLRQVIKKPISYTYDFNRLSKIQFPKNFQNDVEYYYGSAGEENRAGKLELVVDASGGREFTYGRMGETIKEIRTVVASLADIFTYETNFTYDSWNRIQTIFYPDKEIVDYKYNLAGNLYSLSGIKETISSLYVKKQTYDKLENSIYREYGNNAITRNWFDENSYKTRLQHTSKIPSTASEFVFFDETYTYDDAYNLLKLESLVPNFAPNGLVGGKFTQSLFYDNQYRLIKSRGTVVSFGNENLEYDLDLQYNKNNKITSKSQKDIGNSSLNDLNLNYNYVFGKVNRLQSISNASYKFDLNGNLSEIRNLLELEIKQFLWDENNNLKFVNDNGLISQFTYDDQRNRIIKSNDKRSGIFVNGSPAGLISHSQNYTIYINKYIHTILDGFNKHYFFGKDRVVSKIGNGRFINSDILLTNKTAGNFNYFDRFNQFVLQFNNDLKSLGIPPGPPTLKGLYGQPDYVAGSSNSRFYKYENGPKGPPGVPIMPEKENEIINLPTNEEAYWYHQDFFGSTAYMTNNQGFTSIYNAFNPLGELFYQTKRLDFNLNQDFLYKSTELDTDTGFYNFKNNYYRPSISNWLNSSKK